jgi:hypothetical protein
MTLMLASVIDASEAELAVSGVEIVREAGA